MFWLFLPILNFNLLKNCLLLVAHFFVFAVYLLYRIAELGCAFNLSSSGNINSWICLVFILFIITLVYHGKNIPNIEIDGVVFLCVCVCLNQQRTLPVAVSAAILLVPTSIFVLFFFLLMFLFYFSVAYIVETSILTGSTNIWQRKQFDFSFNILRICRIIVSTMRHNLIFSKSLANKNNNLAQNNIHKQPFGLWQYPKNEWVKPM